MLESFWRVQFLSRRCLCWFGGCPFIVEEFHPSRVLKSLFNLACDSSFDVEFSCNWNFLDEKLFRGSWFYVGSDWVGFGHLKIQISVFCPISRSAVSFCCQSDLPGDLSVLGKSLTQSLFCHFLHFFFSFPISFFSVKTK